MFEKKDMLIGVMMITANITAIILAVCTLCIGKPSNAAVVFMNLTNAAGSFAISWIKRGNKRSKMLWCAAGCGWVMASGIWMLKWLK